MNDAINGSFELVGALLSLLNLRVLFRDKQVRGVSWPVTAFWVAWGIWNLHYYPSLGQWFSFAAGILLVSSNAAWVGFAMYYRKQGAA